MRILSRVTTRNFLKVESESFQDVRLLIGVPKGTISRCFCAFLSNQIQRKFKAKKPISQAKMLLFTVDSTGHKWTSKTGVGLRKGYELTLEIGSGCRKDQVSSILPSAFSYAILNSFIKTTSRQTHGEGFNYGKNKH